MKKIIKICVVSFLVLIGLGLVFVNDTQNNKEVITLEIYESLNTGMSYEEVVDKMGFECERNSEVDLNIGDEYATFLITCKGNTLTGNAMLTFQNNKLVTKSKYDLK